MMLLPEMNRGVREREGEKEEGGRVGGEEREGENRDRERQSHTERDRGPARESHAGMGVGRAAGSGGGSRRDAGGEAPGGSCGGSGQPRWRGRVWGAAAARAEARVTVTDGAGPGGSFIKGRIRGPRSHLPAEIEF